MASACAVVALAPAESAAQKARGQSSQPPAQGGQSAGPSAGQVGERIAAVVNEDAVSVSDVNARLRLMVVSAGMPDGAETRQRLMPQVLRQLVDERLQIQEAKRQGITVPKADVDKAVEQLAQQNRMDRAKLVKFLADSGIPQATLTEQVRAQLSWQRVMQRRVRQEVAIADEDVDAAMQRVKESIGKPEYLVAEIYLAVDNPDQDEQVRRAGERLIDEIRKGGNFAAVARQFSQSTTAASSGDLGWVRPGELDPQIDAALAQLRPGQLSQPVRTASGYHILLVRSKRAVGGEEEAAPPPQPVVQRVQKPDIAKAKVNMKQIAMPASDPSQLKAVAAQMEQVRKAIKSCADFTAKANAIGMPDGGDMGMLRVKDLAPGLQNLALGIPLGQPSPVINTPGGSLILIVCKRDVPMITETVTEKVAAPPPPPPKQAQAPRLPTRDEVEGMLIQERAELVARRYLRDLRRAAFVEYRV
ncbi:peptidylprolyl isomerase [Azospirillum sp. TSO22-1]|uniref:peptidylprolyl isomerase n=1 Tax=Azospirillum sp. TSO22-1 TaxID=716789 RepID=UPI001FFE40EC|nr:peptidylprolyl isomerase [Azospirillum sp. TSO22-1]